MPNEFLQYMKYCKNLKEEPNYNYLRNIFKSLS